MTIVNCDTMCVYVHAYLHMCVVIRPHGFLYVYMYICVNVCQNTTTAWGVKVIASAAVSWCCLANLRGRVWCNPL